MSRGVKNISTLLRQARRGPYKKILTSWSVKEVLKLNPAKRTSNHELKGL